MSATTDDTASSAPSIKPILGIAAVACVACCIGPILGVLGAIAGLGLVSTILIGAAGLLIAAAAVAALIAVRRRRRATVSCSDIPEQVPVELTRKPVVNRHQLQGSRTGLAILAAAFAIPFAHGRTTNR